MTDIDLNHFRHLVSHPSSTQHELYARGGSLEIRKTGVLARLGRFFARHSTLQKGSENASDALYMALANQY
jgi:hypothetical protein